MFSKYSTRRKFLEYGSLPLIFLLNSCINFSRKIKIIMQKSFYPNSFINTIPKIWQKENINFGSINSEKNKNLILDSDFTLINDGWINSINFKEFEKINQNRILANLDRRSRTFLNTFEENQRNKLFPVGVVPYAIVIKNNKELIYEARQSWDFMLSKKLKRKIIFPNSPRVILSISKKINESNSLAKLKSQALLFDDQNSLNWLINTDAIIAIIPYTLCLKYLKIDSRLSIVFPKDGVPLMWHFILSRSNSNLEILIRWIKSLESEFNIDKLVNEGWYLPFKNKYLESKYNPNLYNSFGPSKICWDRSWSFPPLTNSQKVNLEEFWNKSLTP